MVNKLKRAGAMNNLDMEKVIHTLIKLLAEQEGAVIEYTIEKTA